MAYTYTINSQNLVFITDYEAEKPRVHKQPFWPDTTPWTKEEAEAWAILFCEWANNRNAEFLPGLTPKQPKRPNPDYDPDYVAPEPTDTKA